MRKIFTWEWKIIAVLLTATFIFGVVFHSELKDYGVAGMKTMENIPDGVELSCVYGMQPEDEEIYTEEEIGRKTGWRGMDTAPVIAIVTPTGKINQSAGSFGQEIKIRKVLRGEESLSEGDKVYFYKSEGFSYKEYEEYEQWDPIVQFEDFTNIMQEGYDYLIFMEESSLNPYQQTKIFYDVPGTFDYIRTDGAETETRDEDFQSYDFKDLKEYEFFSISDQITDIMNSVKREILEEYL